jgi:Ca2+/Na+ antiporter
LDFSKLKQNWLHYSKKIISPILASIVMGIFIYFTREYFNVIFLTLCGAVIYGIFLWVFRFFKEYDKQLFKQLIPKRLQKNESSNPSSWQQ